MIELSNAWKTYGKNGDSTGVNALAGISLTVDEGDYIAIMGASGSGKSTLLYILGGMDRLTEGEYRFDGEVVSSMGTSQLHEFRKKNVSFIFQYFALMNSYTVYENAELPLLAREIKKTERKDRVEEALRKVGILEKRNFLPAQLSGGQQQRCAIARALANDSRLLLADEPTGALDKKTGDEIMNLFDEVNRMGKTVIVVTHDPDTAAHAKKIIRIEDGKIITE
jgi:putative ABC transport system ATP-binding protein